MWNIILIGDYDKVDAKSHGGTQKVLRNAMI